MKSDTVQELYTFFKAGYPALTINSAERVRAVEVIRRAGWQMCHERKIKNDKEVEQLFADLGATGSPWKDGPAQAAKAEKGYLYLDADVLVQRFLALSVSEADDGALADRLGQFLNDAGYPVVTWDTVSGFSNILPEGQIENTVELYEALLHLRNVDAFPPRAVFVFHDCHSYLNGDDPRYRALFRALVEGNDLVTGSMRRHLVFLQPHWQPHADIAHALTPVDFSLPDDGHLDREITFISASIDNPDKKVCPVELRWDLVKAMRGLTTVEAVNALAYCVVRHRGWVPEAVPTMHKLTAAALAKNDVLEIVPDEKTASADQIGGFENYLEFVAESRECYDAEAFKAGLKKPKGCLLLGIPGSGKSMVAMATAKLMRLPLIKYDFGAVFNALIGQSEATQRQALRQVSARGPCVLLIDEADKAFSGIIGSSGDSGVGQRVFGRLLSWMANENDSAFVIMTMNRIVDSVTGAQIVPVETLRAGRIETTFFTTFPDPDERQAILTIHLVKNGAVQTWDQARGMLSGRQWQDLVTATNEYVGSELEQIVIKAVRTAFVRRKELTPTFEELMAAKAYVTPVAKLDDANIKAIDRFCKDRAVPVSKPKKAKMSGGRSGRSLDLGSSGDN